MSNRTYLIYRIAAGSFDRTSSAIWEIAHDSEDRLRRIGWPEDAAARAATAVHDRLIRWAFEEANRS